MAQSPILDDFFTVPDDLATRIDRVERALPQIIPPSVDALPLTANHGQLCLFQTAAMEAAGVPPWLLRYRAKNGDGSANASAFKWEPLGPPVPLTHEIATDNTLNNVAYNDLGVVGPTITLPLAGDYIDRFGARYHNDAAAAQNVLMALKRGAAATADADAASAFAAATGVGGAVGMHGRMLRVNGAAAGDVHKCQYRNSGGVGNSGWSTRWLEITPARVG